MPPSHSTHRRETAGYDVAFIALGLVLASLGPTLPGLAAQTGARLGGVSFLFTARSLGYLLGSMRGGRLFDRLPGHPLIAAALLLMALALALVPLVPWLGVLAVLLLVLGFGEGSLDVGVNTLLVWLHRRNLDPYMNALHFFFGVGAFLSPILIARAMEATGGIAWAYWALALLVLPAAVWIVRLPSPSIHLTRESKAPVRTPPFLIVLVAACFFLCVGAESSFGGWIFTYATARHMAGQAAAAYLTSAFWGAFTLGRLLGIPLAFRFQPRTLLVADLLGCTASVGAILLWQTAVPVLWLGTFGMGLFLASVFPTLLTLAERRMAITGRTTGWFFVGSSLGSMSLPWLIGQLFEPVGPQATMVVILADLLVALAVFAFLILRADRPAHPPCPPETA